jgi:hypothetical protein
MSSPLRRADRPVRARYGLPAVYSGHNELYHFGPPPDTATVVLFVGYDREEVAGWLADCAELTRLDNGVGVDNEEQGNPVLVCRQPHQPWHHCGRNSSITTRLGAGQVFAEQRATELVPDHLHRADRVRVVAAPVTQAWASGGTRNTQRRRKLTPSGARSPRRRIGGFVAADPVGSMRLCWGTW